LAQLAIIGLTEVDRQLYATFISTFINRLDETTAFDGDENSPASLADYLAASFPLFLQTKLDNLADEVFPMMVWFVIITCRHRRFQESVRHGDSIAFESLYNCFSPIWLATGKHHYFEICLTQMEELYHAIPF
jgi:hypothetical protein